MIHRKLISVFCAHACIIPAQAFFPLLCKQAREEQELIYGYITHVIFLFCYGCFVCIGILILRFSHSQATFRLNNPIGSINVSLLWS